MMLVVDAGNTNIVMAVHDGARWRGIWRISTDAQRTSDEYAVWLLTLLQHNGLKRAGISRAVIGTVVPAGGGLATVQGHRLLPGVSASV